jgi:signal transduction histidine kinase
MRSIQMLAENIDEYGKNEFIGYVRRIKTDAEEVYASHENLWLWVANQRGFLEYAPEALDVHEVVAYNVARFTPQAERKKITLSSAVLEETLVYADYHMVDTILRNLFSNALKFTAPEGTIRIATALKDNMVEVSVTDTGTGIHAERIAWLFHTKPYAREDEKVGLGLLLCRELVEKHDGHIWCTSEVGKGTTITFTLPKNKE